MEILKLIKTNLKEKKKLKYVYKKKYNNSGKRGKQKVGGKLKK